ncbi:hypothetical protein Gorai_016676 [Gossypium raimondii]|uniref:Reverse transcriptase zinc-binding domain-containing protein n=1 Tax=Gossypium raimondii TaxID=29730 RepID=A0A7J8P9H7_GOSRA|nr:hypothetical protein [Gossypium raimondii]
MVKLLNYNEYSVRDLWLDESRGWNTCRVRELYGQDFGEKICNLLIEDENHNDRMFFWKAIWKLDTLSKILVFTWCMGNEIFPTNVKIASIHRGFSQACPSSIISKEYDRCIDWLEDMLRVLDKRAMADLITILWNCWNKINNYLFREKEEEAKVISDMASRLSKEFRICNLLHVPMMSSQLVDKN